MGLGIHEFTLTDGKEKEKHFRKFDTLSSDFVVILIVVTPTVGCWNLLCILCWFGQTPLNFGANH